MSTHDARPPDAAARAFCGELANASGAIVRSERVPALVAQVAAHGGLVVGAIKNAELRGYAALVPSSALKSERWENLPDLFELGSIEVARSARGNGIGTELLDAIGASLPLESLLLFARGLVSHWDIEGDRTGFSRRTQLLHMLGKIGFSRWDTTDPEVRDHPLSFLAVRAGRDAPSRSLLALAECAYS
jgi:GNAT superfamily N-acetyltransferase